MTPSKAVDFTILESCEGADATTVDYVANAKGYTNLTEKTKVETKISRRRSEKVIKLGRSRSLTVEREGAQLPNGVQKGWSGTKEWCSSCRAMQ